MLLILVTVQIYGAFRDYAEIDNRVRSVQFSYQGNGEVAVVVPHFWETAGMI